MKKQFSRSAVSVEEEEELRKMDLAVVRVGAGSLARVNGRVTEGGGGEGRESERGERNGEKRGNTTER